jgi:pimeloyl-ACP methyl ester carboxylesterase
MNGADYEEFKGTRGADGKAILSGWRHMQRQNKRAVLFVHGLIGDPKATWVAPSGVDFLELMAKDPELVDYDVFGFGYETRLLSGSRIENVAKQLSSEIQGALNSYQIVLIAHSMGGLVCMRYVQDQLEHRRAVPILGLLLYGTPTTGTELVRLAKTLGFMLELSGLGVVARAFGFLLRRHRQLEELATASEFLQRLHDGWSLRVVNGGHTDLRDDERAWLPVRVVTAEKDFFVSEPSAKSFYGESDWHPLAFTHTALVKPESHDDVRYQRAREFLKICRRVKSAKVLAQIWKASQAVWKRHRGRLIKDWKYRVNIHGGNDKPVDAQLQEAGFSPCVVECSYTTILEQNDIHVGISLGEIAAFQLWDKGSEHEQNTPIRQPAYVHGLFVETYPEAEQGSIYDALDRVLSGRNAEASWATLFPKMSVSIADASQKRDIEVPANEIRTEDAALTRSFTLPANAAHLMGEEVTLKINYESIVPRTLPSFHVMFPWLTERCNCTVIVHGTTEYFVATPHLIGTPKIFIVTEAYGSSRKVLIKSEELVLPDSSVELRWLLRANRPR